MVNILWNRLEMDVQGNVRVDTYNRRVGRHLV
jgi:hypothetical protein